MTTAVQQGVMVNVQRGETTVGPVAVGGQTITLVARTRALTIGGHERGALHVRSRPTHVEVLDAEGRRAVVRVRDVELGLIAGVASAALVCITAVRALRKKGH
jgi:hypothetical protein